MSHWTLETHGDRREKRWWPEISKRFPSYETVWRTYVAPQTYRVIDASVLLVRPDAPYPKLASANYGTFGHLAEAQEELDRDPNLSSHAALYLFFSRLFSAQDVAKRFGSSVRGLLRDLGHDTPKDLKTWFEQEGAGNDWSVFSSVRNLASDYRGTYVHDIEPIRIGSQIPRAEYIKSYADLSRLALVLADQELLQREFQPVNEIAIQPLESLEAACEVLWQFFLAQLNRVEAPTRVATQLQAVSADDETRLRIILARRDPT